jgi:hypothetical protein
VAIYVPESRRRRTLIVVAVVCVVIGLVLGFVAGRASSPSLGDRVHDVQEQARQATSQLRVVALHEDASTGTDGNSLALKRARTELTDALDDASWITAADGKAMLASVDALRGDSSANTIEGVAKKIDAAFGITG